MLTIIFQASKIPGSISRVLCIGRALFRESLWLVYPTPPDQAGTLMIPISQKGSLRLRDQAGWVVSRRPRLQRPPFNLHILLPPLNKLQYFSDLRQCGWKVISCCWGHQLKVMALVPGKGGADASTGLHIITLPTHSKTT